MPVIKLFIIDENPGVLRALAGRLASSARLQILGTSGNLKQGLRKARRSHADVILIDAKTVRSPEAASQLRQIRRTSNGHAPQVIVLAAFADELERKSLEEAGAGRYLLKDIDSQALIREIEAIGSVPSRD